MQEEGFFMVHDLEFTFMPTGCVRRIVVTCSTGGCRQTLEITTRTGKLPAAAFTHAGTEYEIPQHILDAWGNYDPQAPRSPTVKWI
jgi:hypothetical protein